MDEVMAVEFARLARMIGDRARQAGWLVPDFRSPPGVAGALRTLRRRSGGGVVIAVRVRGRPSSAVTGDMIEGVLAANNFHGAQAAAARSALWALCGVELSVAA